MSNDLPPVSSSDCETSSCEEVDPTGKCYTTKEAIPVCSTTNPAGSLASSDCTRLDNTYDILLQSFVVPAVGEESVISICNASIYTVGSWVEFSDGSPGAIFQITAVNSVEKYIKVRNSCSDGETAIDGNPSPGASIVTGARFVISSSPSCSSLSDRIASLQEEINEASDLCFEGISERLDQQEEVKLLGVVASSDCEEGEAQPCLRTLLTREAKDGSLILGNVDENQLGDDILTKLFVNSANKLVTGDPESPIYKWLLDNEVDIATHTSDPGSQQEYAINNAPDDATHVIIQVHAHIDDNPAGNITVSFGNLSPIRTFGSEGESYAIANISVPIVDDKIVYLLSATDGGSMDFSGSTEIELLLIGYEKITTINV